MNDIAAFDDAARQAVVHSATARLETFDDTHPVEGLDVGRASFGAVFVGECINGVGLFADDAGAPLGKGFLARARDEISRVLFR